MNRRRPTFGLGIPLPRLGRVVIAPHTRGDLDPILRAAVVTGEGNPIAVLWGTSCHPVCAPDTHAVSADYPGEVRVALRRFFGTDLPVLFLQGFSGDVRPNTTSRRPPTTAKQLGYFVAAGCHRFVEQDERAFGSWCELLAEAAVATVGRCSPAEPVTLRSTRVERNIPGWERSPQMHLIELAPDLAILAVNAEVVSSRAAALPTMSQRDGLTIPVGCCDSVIGYWPTDRMRAEGGYEAVRSCSFFPPVDFAVVDGPDKLWNEMVSALCTKNRMR